MNIQRQPPLAGVSGQGWALHLLGSDAGHVCCPRADATCTGKHGRQQLLQTQGLKAGLVEQALKRETQPAGQLAGPWCTLLCYNCGTLSIAPAPQ